MKTMYFLIAVLVLIGSTASADLVFSEGFENGLQASTWSWRWNNSDNVGARDVHIETTNPHAGNACLFASGADWLGGAFFMQPLETWSLGSVQIDLWYRNMALTGGASQWYENGRIDINLYNSAGDYIAHTSQRAGLGFDMLMGDMTLAQTVFSPTNISSVPDWHSLRIEYERGQNSTMSVFLDGQQINTLSIAQDLGDFGYMQLGAAGMYRYGGAVYLDDIAVRTVPVPEPSTMCLIGLALSGLVGKRILSRKG